jgi:hypothetical protein
MQEIHDYIARTFERVAKDVKIDKALLARIHHYERAFLNRNDDHIQFFGGNLMGVHPIRFRSIDRDDWFTDVLQIDELELHDALDNLPAVNSQWVGGVRASDTMNISCMWLVHEINKSPHLSVQEKKEGMVDTLLVLQYKFLSSLMAHYYPYPADKATMEATYANMSRRYALKVAGSWNVMLRQRAEEIISPSGIHKATYTKFNNDKDIGNMIQDIQGRLRKIVQSMTDLFYQTRATGGRIGMEKAIKEIDGEKILQDKTRHYSTYKRYIHTVMDDPRSFIRQELVDLIADIHSTLDPRRLVEALEWCSINHREKMPRWEPKVAEGGYVEAFVDEVLLYVFSLVTNKQANITKGSGIGPLLAQLRTLYMASRMSDPSLLKAKEMADNIVDASIHSRNVSVAAATRTGLELYIVLRTLAMQLYS